MDLYGGNPYSVQQYQLPNGNVVSLTAQQYQAIFGQGTSQPVIHTQLQQQEVQSPMTSRQNSQPTIEGRIVDSHDEIKPSEIPMNGQFCYFPSSDGSVIFAKRWDSNGNIQNERYIREQQAMSNAPSGSESGDLLTQIMERLDSIETKLDKQRPYKKPYNKNHNNQTKQPKEV